MRKIILSVNSNPVYLYYLPLTVWSWLRAGWEPIVLYNNQNTDKDLFNLVHQATKGGKIIAIQGDEIKGYRNDTITQISRLYGAVFAEPDDLVITGDIDMLALSDFWNPDPSGFTVYGFDLTNRTEAPICYVSATSKNWLSLMNIDSSVIEHHIQRDLDTLPDAKGEDFYTFWSVDQKFLTQKLKGVQPQYIDRGRYANGLAIGRVDRGEWSMNHEHYYDAHLHRDLYKAFQDPKHEHFSLYQKKWAEHMDLLNTIWPEEDLNWFVDYTIKFAKLAK